MNFSPLIPRGISYLHKQAIAVWLNWNCLTACCSPNNHNHFWVAGNNFLKLVSADTCFLSGG